MKNIFLILALVLSIQAYSQNKELPVCTTIEDLKIWEKYLEQHPNEKQAYLKMFDLYYYQVLFDYSVTSLDHVDDLRELVSYCNKYLALFPSGLNVDAIKDVKKSSNKGIREIEIKIEKEKARQREIARQRELASSKSSSNSSVSKKNINQYVSKIEYSSKDGENSYYRVYFTDGKSHKLRYRTKAGILSAKGWAVYGGIGNWIDCYSDKEDALVHAYEYSH